MYITKRQNEKEKSNLHKINNKKNWIKHKWKTKNDLLILVPKTWLYDVCLFTFDDDDSLTDLIEHKRLFNGIFFIYVYTHNTMFLTPTHSKTQTNASKIKKWNRNRTVFFSCILRWQYTPLNPHFHFCKYQKRK